MTYQASDRTWLKSIQVFEGYTIKTANKCNDDYNYDTPRGGGITIGTTLTSSDGCKDQHTDFNYVEFKSKVAKGSDLPAPCQNLKLGPGEIICSKITNKDLTALDTSRINRALTCEVYARTNGKNCAQWCESKGLHCMYAQDNKGDQCTLDPRILRQEVTGNGCYQEYGDQVCACAPVDVDTICKKGFYEQAPQVTYIVNAKNSAPATNGLKTGTNVQMGDFITIGANPTDCWSAGSTVRTSDANGLGACTTGTACVDSCNTQFGKYTSGGSSFLYGSLVGRIGTSGPWFKIGTSYEGAMPKSGTLYLGFWDSSYGDNKGTIQVTVSGTLRTSDGQRDRAEGTCVPCKKSCSKPCFRDLGLNSKQCPVQRFSFMKAADCDAHGCQCQGCKTTYSKPPPKTRVTPKKRVCQATKFRRLSHSQCYYSTNDNPMWGGGGFLGQKTRAECQACCANSPGCVAFEWSSHSTDPNAKANCAFAWGCERVAGWGGGDAFLSNCARRGTGYKKKDQKGSYSTAKCNNKPTPKPKKRCEASDFMQAGKGGNSDPFALMEYCSNISSKSKVCEICACVSELNPRAVRRVLDCTVNDVPFLKVFSAHRNCKPCSFSPDGPVVVHG